VAVRRVHRQHVHLHGDQLLGALQKIASGTDRGAHAQPPTVIVQAGPICDTNAR